MGLATVVDAARLCVLPTEAGSVEAIEYDSWRPYIAILCRHDDTGVVVSRVGPRTDPPD